MSLRIGLDFDNTIICYDPLFHSLALEKKWIPRDLPADKNSVKDFLISEDGHDFRWQALQALAYGEKIFKSRFFPFFTAFLKNCKNWGHDIFIVSHKSETSHYDPTVNLREYALQWMEKNQLLGELSRKNIFFASDREEKFRRIEELQCDLFVDDLFPLLTDKAFPEGTLGLHFNPKGEAAGAGRPISCRSWKEVAKFTEVMGEIGRRPFIRFIQEFGHPPLKAHFLKREGNNKIVELAPATGKKIILKSFRPGQDRAEKEVLALTTLWKNKIQCVPRLYHFDRQDQFVFIEYLKGTSPVEMNEATVRQMGEFLGRLYDLAQNSDLSSFPLATDGRLSLQEYVTILERRLLQIEEGIALSPQFSPLGDLLEKEILPLKEEILEKFFKEIVRGGWDLDGRLAKEETILSPSDFGPHNAILKGTRLYFLDFEYFGVDDPAKLVADFFHHAANPGHFREKWILLDQVRAKMKNPARFTQRFELVADLIGLEWILIVLNIASPGVLERRLFSNPALEAGKLIEERRARAARKLQEITEIRNLGKLGHPFLTIP